MGGSLLFGFLYWGLSSWRDSPGLLVVGLLFAALGGMMPDQLEPPTGPDHRGAWHYLGGLLSALPAYSMINAGAVGFVIGSFCVGYFSHFVLDIAS